MEKKKEKSRIAILTFFRAYNYGGDLQCYALQRKLRNLGYDTRVLNLSRPVDDDYKHDKIDSERFAQIYKHNSKYDLISLLKRKIYRSLTRLIALFQVKKIKLRNEKFDIFYKNYIKLSTRRYLNFNELYSDSNNLNYTHYIVGSDQVWNYAYPFSIEPYLLTFVQSGKKISYAASIGNSIMPSSVGELYRNWLSDFKSISLREKQGADLIHKVTERKDVQTVLDPTFLLTKEEWISGMTIEEPLVDNGYVLVYLLSKSDYAIKIAKEIAEQKGLKVIGVTSSFIRHRNIKGVEYLMGNDPRDFVNLINYASFVVTNSFHGTAFSVNFNVPFVSVVRRSTRVNSRFINLLEITSLEDRLYYEGDKFEYCNLKKIDYTEINFTVNKERKRSLTYLLDALKD